MVVDVLKPQNPSQISREPLEADVLILAAGFGTRLRPLTNTTPKPLIEVDGKSLLAWNLELVARAGARRVFINLHYLGEKIEEAIGDGSQFGLEVCYSWEPEVILDTGGAIRQIESQLLFPNLITLNSDTLVDPGFPIRELLKRHQTNGNSPLITCVLRADGNADRYGTLGIDSDQRVVEFLGETYFQASATTRYMYTGIQVISRDALSFMEPLGNVFSVTRHTYRAILAAGGFVHAEIYPGFWNDVGTPERLADVRETFPRLLQALPEATLPGTPILR